MYIVTETHPLTEDLSSRSASSAEVLRLIGVDCRTTLLTSPHIVWRLGVAQLFSQQQRVPFSSRCWGRRSPLVAGEGPTSRF